MATENPKKKKKNRCVVGRPFTSSSSSFLGPNKHHIIMLRRKGILQRTVKRYCLESDHFVRRRLVVEPGAKSYGRAKAPEAIRTNVRSVHRISSATDSSNVLPGQDRYALPDTL
ncbi:hypothetical protein MTO96_044766 [Rhipicephalus appendiculatus]